MFSSPHDNVNAYLDGVFSESSDGGVRALLSAYHLDAHADALLADGALQQSDAALGDGEIRALAKRCGLNIESRRRLLCAIASRVRSKDSAAVTTTLPSTTTATALSYRADLEQIAGAADVCSAAETQLRTARVRIAEEAERSRADVRAHFAEARRQLDARDAELGRGVATRLETIETQQRDLQRGVDAAQRQLELAKQVCSEALLISDCRRLASRRAIVTGAVKRAVAHSNAAVERCSAGTAQSVVRVDFPRRLERALASRAHVLVRGAVAPALTLSDATWLRILAFACDPLHSKEWALNLVSVELTCSNLAMRKVALGSIGVNAFYFAAHAVLRAEPLLTPSHAVAMLACDDSAPLRHHAEEPSSTLIDAAEAVLAKRGETGDVLFLLQKMDAAYHRAVETQISLSLVEAAACAGCQWSATVVESDRVIRALDAIHSELIVSVEEEAVTAVDAPNALEAAIVAKDGGAPRPGTPAHSYTVEVQRAAAARSAALRAMWRMVLANCVHSSSLLSGLEWNREDCHSNCIILPTEDGQPALRVTNKSVGSSNFLARVTEPILPSNCPFYWEVLVESYSGAGSGYNGVGVATASCPVKMGSSNTKTAGKWYGACPGTGSVGSGNGILMGFLLTHDFDTDTFGFEVWSGKHPSPSSFVKRTEGKDASRSFLTRKDTYCVNSIKLKGDDNGLYPALALGALHANIYAAKFDAELPPQIETTLKANEL